MKIQRAGYREELSITRIILFFRKNITKEQREKYKYIEESTRLYLYAYILRRY